MALDLLFVLDDKDRIKMNARQAMDALLHLKPELKIDKRATFDSDFPVRTKRILFFLSGDGNSVHNRIKTWTNMIEYTLVIEVPYFIVFYDVNNHGQPYDETVNEILYTSNFDMVSTWWPRVVQFLFDVGEFTQSFEYYSRNVSSGYEIADRTTEAVTNLMEAFGGVQVETPEEARCSHGFLVVRYTARNDDETRESMVEMKRSIKTVYEIGTCMQRPQRLVASADFHSRSEILAITLGILKSLGIIDVSNLTRRDSLCTRYLGLHVDITRKKPPRSRRLTENIVDVFSETTSNPRDDLCCVVTASCRCLVIALVLLSIVVLSVGGGLFYLTIQHNIEIRQIEEMIEIQRRLMDEIEADAAIKFPAANTSLYQELEILKNETAEKFQETNETIYATVDILRNETTILFEEFNITVYAEVALYENDTDNNLTNIFITPVAFEAHTIHDTSPAIGARLMYQTATTNEGNSYTTDGRFTAPVAGIYLTLFEMCIVPDKIVLLYSYCNGINRFTFYSYNGYSCQCGFKIGLLSTSNVAYTVVYHSYPYSSSWPGRYRYYNILTNSYSTSFSGFLINKRN